MEDNLDTLDLSGSKLKKLNKPNPTEAHNTVLILDDNELQRLDNIDSFTKVQKLSVVRNQLLRMYGVCRLHALHTLNLSHNGILTIEGLKELVHLKHLCLAGNNIKTIEHLHTNVNLEHLDLSENSISHISDLSFLKNLKELLLNGNRIGHLRQCERYLPTSLVTLTLAANNITDLNEISQLVHLVNITNISIANNPCVNMTGNNVGFDYRPFIINWCMSIKNIDGYLVDAIESLRAEWLYSQGRGRHFRIGDHQELTQYLATVCPLSGETLETEEDRKLRLILSKAQHHQQQLRDQLTTNGIVESSSPSPASKRRINSNRNSPRLNSSRLSGNRPKSPDRMASSCYSVSGSMDNSSLMTQSLDPNILSQSVVAKINNSSSIEEPITAIHEFCLNETIDIHSPLKGASKLVPVPESLMSPDYRPSNSLVSRLATPHQSNNNQHTATVTTHNIPTGATTNPIGMSRSNHLPRKDHNIGGSPKLGRSIRPRSAIVNTSSPLRTRKLQPTITTSLPMRTEHPPPHAAAPPLAAAAAAATKTHINSEDEFEIYSSKLETIRNIAQVRKKNADDEINNEIIKHELAKIETVKLEVAKHEQEKREMLKREQEARELQELIAAKEIEQKENERKEELEKMEFERRELDKSEHNAAVLIQKLWRGYQTRNCNKKTLSIYEAIKSNRTQEHLQKLTLDMESTKAALESEHKIQMLHMQAISQLWKKVSNIPPYVKPDEPNQNGAVDNSDQIKNLTQTCSMLRTEVRQLQHAMQDMVRCVSMYCQTPNVNHQQGRDVGIATQTEIVAVHTPQGEAGKVFPFQKSQRPSSLPLPVTQRVKQPTNTTSVQTTTSTTNAPHELKQFAGSLVEGVIKTVSETNLDNNQIAEIIVTDTDRCQHTLDSLQLSDDADDTTLTETTVSDE